MTKTHILKSIASTFSLALISCFGFANIANALGTPASTGSTGASSVAASSNGQATVATIIAKGNAEITRRLTALGGLSTKIGTMTKLTNSDETSLGSEVTSEIAGLTSLKATLDAATTVTAARAAAIDIFSDYRVYALILPKVYLIKVADDQIATQAKLTTLTSSLTVALNNAPAANTSLATLKADLSDMTAKVAAASQISTTIETSVLPLQPTDYDTNHTVLSGDRMQLATAQSDDKAALTDAKSIMTGLK